MGNRHTDWQNIPLLPQRVSPGQQLPLQKWPDYVRYQVHQGEQGSC